MMDHEQIREFFAQQQQHWRDRDAAALADGHAADGTIISPIFRTVTGRDEIVASYRSVFEIFPDWDYRAEHLLVDGSRVAESFTVSATHRGEFMGIPGTGRRFTIDGVRLFTMRDGRIGYERRYYDFTGMLIQLGVIRGKPSR
jgi:steroid delta-isomerase-like uncharacterized protein